MAASALIAVGLVVLVLGAELVVRGGSRLAERFGVSPLIVGLTVVAIGTSAPELATGIDAARGGVGDLAVGNVAGSNMANLLLILGVAALLRPFPLRAQTRRLDLPALALAAMALLLMAVDGALSHLDGALLLVIALVYTVVILAISRPARAEARRRPLPSRSPMRMVLEVVALVAGIGAVVCGADWLVHGAVGLAGQLGVSDAQMGLTVVAIGTSAPELATTLVDTFHGHRGIAVGNVIGSSFYNIALVLGAAALADPTSVQLPASLVWIDLPVMTCTVFGRLPVFLRGGKVTRTEGGFFVLAYAAYLTYLVVART